MAESTEKQAESVVKEELEAEGWEVENADYGSGYDLDATKNGESKKIEVKGTTKNEDIGFRRMPHGGFEAAQEHCDYEFWVVYNLPDEAEILVFPRDEVLRRVRLDIGWELPIRKADYETYKRGQ